MIHVCSDRNCDLDHALRWGSTTCNVWTKMYFHMRKSRTHVMLSLAILLACCAWSRALDPSLDVNQYAHTVWKVREGFAKGILTSLAQTPDGYLWLGTESGLLRFDGVRPVPWQPPSGQQLPGTLITSLLVAHDGTLWIGTFTGLASWKDGKFKAFPEVAGQSVTSLLEAHDSTVWIGIFAQSGGGVCNIQGAIAQCERDGSKFGLGVMSLYEDSKKTLWLGTYKGVWRWKPSTPEFFSVPSGPFPITSFVEDAQGQLLFSSYAGIRRLVHGHIEAYPSGASAYRWHIVRMFRDHDGGLWVGTSDHGLVHVQTQGRIDLFSRTDGLSGDYVTRFLEDRESNIWVATYDGIDRFRSYAIPTVSANQGLSTAAALSVLASKDGSVWVGSQGGLSHWVNGRISVFGGGREGQKSDANLSREGINSLFEDSGRRVWVSTAEGEVGYLRRGRFIKIQGVPRGTVHSIIEVPSGHIWLSHEQAGLIHVCDGRVLEQIPWARLGRKDHARVLVADPSKTGLWLGFNHGDIAYFRGGTIRASFSAENGLGNGRVNDLRFGPRGALWAATENGLSRIKDGHVTTLTSRNGLPCEKVVATMQDNDRSMWLYLACGLMRITQSELDAWIANPSNVIRGTLFDEYDGVRSHSATGGYPPLMTKSEDGRVWFLPWDGVSVIDPHNLHGNNVPPPVQIEKITADDKTVEISTGMHLPTGVRHLDIDYTALSLVVPEKVHFRVKLEGEDKDWRELVNVRHVEYTNLPPKHYRFRVLACNNSGVWNEQGAALDFVIPPAWYQTNWFRAACVAAFLAMIWGLHELRVRQLAAQLEMRLEERLAERTRIARDLHDTLLQGFQGLLLRLQAVLIQIPKRPEKACEILESALVSAEQAIAEGRGAVQQLRSGSEGSLEQMLLDFSRELASSQKGADNSPTVRVIVEGNRRPKRSMIRDEVDRIARELLRNAYRHGHAQNIEAELRYDDDAFLLIVRDDGKGIDPTVLKDRGRAGHWGLPGMYERAEGMGARLDIWSEVGAGAEVRLRVPAAIAYEKSGDGGRFKLFRKTRIYEHRS